MFSVHALRRRNLKAQLSPVIRSGKSHDYRKAIVFEKIRFQSVFLTHENQTPEFSKSSGLNIVFEKLRFPGVFSGLVWTYGTPDRRNKATFSTFLGLGQTRPSPSLHTISFFLQVKTINSWDISTSRQMSYR